MQSVILDNPLIMAPTQITDAKLTVYSLMAGIILSDLKPEVNHLIIRGGSEFYTFVLEKEGYASQTFQFSAGELINATKENPLGLKSHGVRSTRCLICSPDRKKGRMR